MIIGIVLAAGMGRRIGTPKALLELSGETFYDRALRMFSAAELTTIGVVNAAVSQALPTAAQGEVRVINHDPEQEAGMFSSVRIGVAEALTREASGALILPVDHAFVAAVDVLRVADALRSGSRVVLPTHGGRRGHPIGLSRAVLEEIAHDQGLRMLRDVVRRDPARVAEVAAGRGVLQGVNTQDDLDRAMNAHFR